MTQQATTRPPSATHALVALAGFAGFIASAFAVRLTTPFGMDVVPSVMLIIALTTLAVFAVDILWQKVYLRPSTGLDFSYDDPSWERTLTKWLGLVATVILISIGYWLFPEYHSDFYDSYYALLQLTLVPWLVLALPYFYWVDRRMRNPRDGYWHMGKLLLLKWRDVDRQVLGQHALGWLIKAFFMALMASTMAANLRSFFLFDLGALTGFRPWFDFLYHFMFFIDVGLASMGYAMSLRITDTHIRSAEPTLLGWAVALACYEPFWSLIGSHYLRYGTGLPWDAWLSHRPFLYAVWGTGILVLVAIYVWATVIFGARFSNLTHRGIITNGPYRFSKHPAYIAKNLTWWMMAVPFMPSGSLEQTIRGCLLLLGLNLIYVVRAKTEERHLSRDPAYVEYALWIDRHGLLRSLRRLPLHRHFAYRIPVRSGAAP